jgi:ketosteroid isomerase-like protein
LGRGKLPAGRLIAAGDKVIALVYVRVRLKNKLEWNEGRPADVFTFRNGKVIEMRTFLEQQQALDWAGVKE